MCLAIAALGETRWEFLARQCESRERVGASLVAVMWLKVTCSEKLGCSVQSGLAVSRHSTGWSAYTARGGLILRNLY